MRPVLSQSVFVLFFALSSVCVCQNTTVTHIPVVMTGILNGGPVDQQNPDSLTSWFCPTPEFTDLCGYTVTWSAPWLQVNHLASKNISVTFHAPATTVNLLFTANTSGLGTTTTTSVTVSDGYKSRVYDITLTLQKPTLQLAAYFPSYVPINIPIAITTSSLQYSRVTPGATNFSQRLKITPSSGSGFNYTVVPSSGGGWLDVGNRNGTAPGETLVLVNPVGLGPGTYTGSLTFQSTQTANSLFVPVTLTIIPELISASPPSFNIQFYQDILGGIHDTLPFGTSLPVTLNSSTGDTLTPTVTASDPWLELNTSTPGNTPANLSFFVEDFLIGQLPIGTSSHALVVSAPGAYNSPIGIPITATVAPCTYALGQPTSDGSYSPQVTVPVTTNSDSCRWQAAVNGNPDPITYRGTSTFSFFPGRNPTTSARAFTVTIAGKTVSYTQAGSIPGITLNPGNVPTFTTTAFGLTTAPDHEQLLTDLSGTTASYTVTASSSNTPYPSLFEVSRAPDPVGSGWLTVTPLGQGTTPGQITISANPAGLGPGYYIGEYVITAAGQSPMKIRLTLVVNGVLSVSKDSIFVRSTSAATRTISVTNSTGPLPFSTSSLVQQGAGDLSVSPPNGATPGNVSVTMMNEPGIQDLTKGVVSIGNQTLPGEGFSIPVTYDGLSSRPVGTPPFDGCCTFTYPTGQIPAPQSLAVTATGAPLFCASGTTMSNGDASWVDVSPHSFTTPAALTITPTAISPDSRSVRFFYNCAFPGFDTLYTFEVDANLNVINASNVGVVTPTQLTFWAEAAGGNPPAQTLQVSSLYGPLAYNVSVNPGLGYSWLTATASSGSTPNTVSVSVNKTGLSPGVYSGTVTLPGIQNLPVTLYVTNGRVMTPSVPTVAFSGVQGAAITPVTIPLSIGAATAFTAAAGSDADWLSVTPTAGSAPGSITLSADAALPPGNYSGKVTVTSTAGNSPMVIPVTLSVTGCAYSVSPSSVSVGGASSVGSITVATAPGCAWSASSGNTSVLVLNGPTTGTGNGTVTYTALGNTTNLPRSAQLTVAGNVVLVSQSSLAKPCLYTLGTSSFAAPAAGGASAFTVATALACAWNASTSDNSWITLAAGNPTQGGGSEFFTVSPNSGPARSATIGIGDQTFAVNQASGLSTCSLSLDSTFASFGTTGGTGSVNVANTCSWSVSSNSAWLTVTSQSQNSGNGPVSYGVAPNTDAARTGVLLIAGQQVSVVQAGGAPGCTFTLSSASANVPATTGGGSVNVAAGAGCSWAISGASDWLTVTSPATGSGNQTVNFVYAGNNGPARGATFNIGGKPFTVTQAGAPCALSLATNLLNFGSGGGSGSTAVTVSSGCPWSATSSDSWIVTSANGNGNGTVNFTLMANAGTTARSAAITVNGQQLDIVQAAAGASSSGGLRFVPVAPCRIADTRNAGGAILGGTSRAFPVGGVCGVASTAAAYSLNTTVVPTGPLGYLTLWPTGKTQPFVSTLNSDGRVKANAAIVPAGDGGQVSVFVTDKSDVVLDVNGYFISDSGVSDLEFYPITPCRIADTRNPAGNFGGPSIGAGQTRDFNPTLSACALPPAAQAYSLNFTVVPSGPLGYLTTWPSGQTQPFVSTLNAPGGAITANAAIVPAGSNGAISVFVTNHTDLVIDVNGYFAPPGSAGALSFYPVDPCRISDTRNPTGTFGGPSLAGGQARSYPVPTSACGVPSTAQAYSLNATVVPPSSLGYLTLWPAGGAQPLVSTLNALDASITANAAIVPAGLPGGISAFATSDTDLILDINGYFGP